MINYCEGVQLNCKYFVPVTHDIFNKSFNLFQYLKKYYIYYCRINVNKIV